MTFEHHCRLTGTIDQAFEPPDGGTRLTDAAERFESGQERSTPSE